MQNFLVPTTSFDSFSHDMLSRLPPLYSSSDSIVQATQALFIAALATFMLGSSLVPGVLLPLLKQLLTDVRLLIVGLVGMACAFGAIAFFENVFVFFVASAVLGLGGLVSPAAFSIVSTHIADCDQGLAQGAFAAVTSLSAVLAQVTFDSLFVVGNTAYHNAGFAFYFALGFCVVAVACALAFERALGDDDAATRVSERHQTTDVYRSLATSDGNDNDQDSDNGKASVDGDVHGDGKRPRDDGGDGDLPAVHVHIESHMSPRTSGVRPHAK